MTYFMSLHGFRGPLQTIDFISLHACLHGPSTVLTVICKPLKTLPPRSLHGPLSTHPHTPTRPGVSNFKVSRPGLSHLSFAELSSRRKASRAPPWRGRP